MTAFEFLKYLKEKWPWWQYSNSQLFRLLRDRAVQINGVKPTPYERVEFPITNLVIHPNNKGIKTTLV